MEPFNPFKPVGRIQTRPNPYEAHMPQAMAQMEANSFAMEDRNMPRQNIPSTMKSINTIDLNRLKVIVPPPRPIRGEMHGPQVIALDPGETTGWSVIQVTMEIGTKGLNVTDQVVLHQHGEVDCIKNSGQLDTETPVTSGNRNVEAEAAGIARLMHLIAQFPQAAVVIEDFILDRKEKTRDLLSPVRLTARIDQELWRMGRRSFIQDRANAKATMTDDRLRNLGRYQREGGLGHARDADRHALYFLRRCQTKPWLRHQAWPHLFEEPTAKVSKKRAPNAPGQRIKF